MPEREVDRFAEVLILPSIETGDVRRLPESETSQ